jgi:hypothetical protein
MKKLISSKSAFHHQTAQIICGSKQSLLPNSTGKKFQFNLFQPIRHK